MGIRMACYVTLFLALLGVCFPVVSSLDCYSCFSYESNVECESQYSLKKVTCDGHYDTCLKYEMKIRIAEAVGNGSVRYVLNPGFARYCGRKEDCNSYPQVCRHTFRHDGEVKACNITCCSDDITSKCHETPHYPGNGGSTNILTSNQTVGKGARGGRGAHLTATIWLLFMTGALIWMFV